MAPASGAGGPAWTDGPGQFEPVPRIDGMSCGVTFCGTGVVPRCSAGLARTWSIGFALVGPLRCSMNWGCTAAARSRRCTVAGPGGYSACWARGPPSAPRLGAVRPELPSPVEGGVAATGCGVPTFGPCLPLGNWSAFEGCWLSDWAPAAMFSELVNRPLTGCLPGPPGRLS